MEHSFNVQFAKKYGIEEAIIVHNFYFWLRKNIANEKHLHNGRAWTYNSNTAFTLLFPYINKTKVFRVLKNLEENKIILKGNFNENVWDKTLWYSFSDFGFSELNACGYDIIDFVKMNHRDNQNEPTIPYNKHTDSNKEIEDNKLSSTKKDIDDFVDRMYKLYPTKCPKRNCYLGKSNKDKQRIKTLLKTYSKEQIEQVFNNEIEEKYNKQYMQNFSTFLNNFPDPDTICVVEKETELQNNNEVKTLSINGQIYR